MKITSPTLTIAALALLASSVSSTAKGAHRYQPRDRSVQSVAYELEKATRHLARDLERHGRWRHHRESGVLDEFRILENQARSYRRIVTRYDRGPWSGIEVYEALVVSYNRAHSRLGYFHVSQSHFRDFERVGALLGQLQSHYRRANYRSQPRGYRKGHYGKPKYRGRGEGEVGVRIQLPRFEIQWDWRH